MAAKGILVSLLGCLVLLLAGVNGQAQVYSVVGGSVNINIQLPDQNTNIISPSGQTMIEVGFFGDPSVSSQYRNRVRVTNYSGGFGTPTITFTFSGVQLTDAGDFQCTSTFGGNTQCGPTLIVLGNPTLPQLVVTPSPVIAGRDVEMTCSATSTSRPRSPSLVLVYVLKQNGNVIAQPRTSSFLIKGVAPQNKGDRFQCQAFELNTVTNQLTGLESGDSDSFVLDPNYAPTDIASDPPDTSYSLNRDQRISDIRCSADCYPECDFGWYKSPDDQIVAQGPVLSLDTVTSEEAGTYVCKATNTLGEKLLPIKIDVQESLGDVTFSPGQDSYTVLEGSTIPDILCNAECVPQCQFEWLRDGRFLYESDGISFGSVSRGDSGVYTCRASNDKGSNEKNLQVDVQYAPTEVSLNPAALTYELEENAAVIPDIACSADCNPGCQATWYKKGDTEPLSDALLVLGTATRSDTATYDCKASNQFGEVTSQEVSIQIFYRPETVTFEPPTPSYDVGEGVTISPITCQAECNPPCDFQWFKDNDFSRPTVSSSVLDLGLADLEDSGQWTCVASNQYGQLQKQLGVNVAYGPQEIALFPPRELYTVAVDRGVVPDIVCSASCNPPCSFGWFKDNSPSPNASNNTLSLNSVSKGDDGNYTCRAANQLGSITKDVQIVVTFGPSNSIILTPDQTTYEVQLGSPLRVTCGATCDPECSFRWVKEDGQQYSATGQLSIASLTASDGGSFECEASNGVGTPARRKITVKILSGPSTVTITPPGPLSLKQGTDFVITCSATCTPQCDIAWKKGISAIPSSDGTLSLKNVSQETFGVYTCQASNSIGTQDKTIDVEIVYVADDSVMIQPDSDPLTVEEGRDLDLTCSAECNPECQYRWTQGSTPISTGSRLQIMGIERDQSGLFTCIAENEARSPAFKSTTVDVLYGPGTSDPDIFPGEATQQVDRGDTYQARCNAECNPDCQIRWFFGNRLVQTSDGILNLRNVSSSDQGEYTCQASNVVGTKSRVIQLQVQAGPGTTIRLTPPGNKQTAMEGRPLEVICSADCSPPCTFRWQFGSANASDDGRLSFDSISRDDAGTYICFASNSMDSQSSKQLEVEVLYGPKGSTRLIPDSVKNLDVGDRLDLFCAADCSPPCTYIWYLGQKVVPSTDGELRIESVSLSDSGTYLCQANNDVDVKETKEIDIYVKSGPGGSISFNPPNDTVTLTEGNTLQVSCTADCTPACYYTWTLGPRLIPSANGVLSIPAISASDVGDYTCVAANGDGNQATKVLSVTVLYGPQSSIELVPADSVQVLNEGASIQISCRSACNPPCTHQWYFVTTPLNMSSGVLSLFSLGKSDEGNYKCVASNGVGLSAERDVFIQVQTGPGNTVRIEPAVSKYEVNEGNELTLKCSAVCSPPCQYTWYFGSDRSKANDGVLTYPMATRNQSGSYICHAANDVAVKGSQQIQVDVLYGPSKGVMLDPEENQQVEVGDTVILRCSADCHPDCQYRWSVGGKDLTSDGGRLVLGPVNKDSAGDYVCRAFNKVDGMNSKLIRVEVLKSPGDSITFTPDEENPNVEEGTAYSVTCRADCVPACDYAWFKGQTQIPEATNGVLSLQNLKRESDTFYTCKASNDVGAPALKSLILNIEYGPTDSIVLFPPEATVSVGSAVSVSCKAQCNPPCSLVWSRSDLIIPSQQGIMSLANIQIGDAGDYTCKASNSVDEARENAEITVISGSGVNVEFNPPDTNPSIKEGANIQIQCTANCVPPCDFEWKMRDEVVGQNGLLEIPGVQRSDKGVYSCHAKNSAGTDTSRLLSLDVTYGPGSSIDLVPPIYAQQIALGQPLLSRCEAACNPTCDIRWLKDGRVVADNGNLIVRSTQQTDGGVYSCIAANGVDQPARVDLTVTIAFGPQEEDIELQPPGETQSVVEGETFTVVCRADCMPACTYAWYSGNTKYQTDNGLLSLPSVDKSDAGTYTCQASNGVGRTQMKDVELSVQYKPGEPALQPTGRTYTLASGESLPDILCSADCNPTCQIEWLKDGFVISGAELTLDKVSQSDQGIYQCQASNIHGVKTTEIQLIIEYPPSIKLFTIGDRKTRAVIKEGEPVTLFCQVDALPVSNISLYNGTRLLISMEETTELSFALESLDCLDSGIYYCQADNGVGDPMVELVQLQVLCPPRLDPRVFKQPFVASQLGGRAVISVPIVADPTPTFVWYKMEDTGLRQIDISGNPDDEDDLFFYFNDSSTSLVFNNVKEDDYGQYFVSMANTEGSGNTTFNLVPEGPPHQPEQLQATTVDPNTIELRWIPGFNGGKEQQYVIEFRKRESPEWRRIDKTVDDGDWMVSAKVTDLLPSTLYVFRLRGLNEYGYSNFSDGSSAFTGTDGDKTTKTPDEVDPVPLKGDVGTTPVLLGVGLALGFLVGAGITVIIVVSRCRPRSSGHNGENTIDDYKSDTTYDTLYLKDALWAQRHIKLRPDESHRSSSSPYSNQGFDYRQQEDTAIRYDYGKSSMKPSEIRSVMM